eukprot:jgi/Tetstr1/462946/TSEL_007894.t1
MDGLKRQEWNPVTTIGPGKTNDDSIKQFLDAGQGNLNNDPMKIEAARMMRMVQAYLSWARKRARELAEMDIDPNAQVPDFTACTCLISTTTHHH